MTPDRPTSTLDDSLGKAAGIKSRRAGFF